MVEIWITLRCDRSHISKSAWSRFFLDEHSQRAPPSLIPHQSPLLDLRPSGPARCPSATRGRGDAPATSPPTVGSPPLPPPTTSISQKSSLEFPRRPKPQTLTRWGGVTPPPPPLILRSARQRRPRCHPTPDSITGHVLPLLLHLTTAHRTWKLVQTRTPRRENLGGSVLLKFVQIYVSTENFDVSGQCPGR
jgi:hypothetical protein